MKCYKCKREVPLEAKLCPRCGSSQEFTRELIDRAINNDQMAITQLYDMTKDNVYFTVKTMISDEDTVLDLTQDTFIKAIKNLGQLNEPGAFRGWIKTIARNMTIDILRKKRVISFSQMVSADSDEAIEFEDDRQENLPEVVIDRQETTRLIGEILNTLSPEQRVVTELFYYENLSVKEIAKELNISENTVKSRLKYARNKIEVGVLELEKKGTKLYSLAPIPFLLLLLRSQDAYAAELPDALILQAIQSGSASATAGGTSASQLNGSNVVKKGIKTGTEAISKGVSVKITAGIIAVAVIGGAIMGIRNKTTITAEGFAGYYTDQETGTQITILAVDDENATVSWWSPLFSDPNEPETIASPILIQKAVLDGKILVTDSMCTLAGSSGDVSYNIGKHSLTISNNQIIVDILEPAQSDVDMVDRSISSEIADEAIGGTYDPDGDGSLAFGKYAEQSY